MDTKAEISSLKSLMARLAEVTSVLLIFADLPEDIQDELTTKINEVVIELEHY